MDIPRPPKSFFFKGQLLHLLLLLGLLLISFWLVDTASFGINTKAWFVASLAVPIVHQVFVWISWRSQLCRSSITRLLGPNGFAIYGVVFMTLLLARPLVMIGLGISDCGSIELPLAARLILPTLLMVPAIYTFYSVARYFGFSRAMGIDHFDPGYRNAPLVKQGIFRFTSNAMYTFGFLVLWAIALAFASQAALVSALFNHVYIWVHFSCTERPDMELIYGIEKTG